jgi:LysR family hydrogen peroxide-inducible transcriptional activator
MVMAMNLPTVKQLRYFTALAEAGHFGRAAAASFVSQSAFSAAIRELETVLETQLVDRTNRQVTITATGQAVAVQARECLQAIEKLVETAQGPRAPLTGELRLGVIPTIAPFLLPKALPRLRRAHPELQLLLTEDQTQVLHSKLLQGELDVLLLALPFELQATESLALFNDSFMLACRNDSKHVAPDNYRFSQLEPASVILMEDGHCLRDHALDACKLRGTEKLNRFNASSLLTLVEMVDADLGISYLPELAADSGLLRNTRVKLHPLGGQNFRTIGLAWRKGSARIEEFKLLGEFFMR